MALPGDVSKFTLTFGPYTDASGEPVLAGTTGKIKPSVSPIRHTASGSVVIDSPIPVVIDAFGVASVELAHTAQASLSPNAFTYTVVWDVASRRPSPGNKQISVLPTDGTVIDFDLLGESPDVEGVHIPSALSVNGQTGVVVLTASDVGAVATTGLDAASSALVDNAASATAVSLRAAFGLVMAPAPTGVAATDTAALLAAYTSVADYDVATVISRAGTYVVNQPLPVRTGLTWCGQGRTVTTIKVADGANCDAFQSENFATLTGTSITNLTQAPYGFAIEHLAVDGNKANQTGTSWGIRVYGHSFRLNELHIRNCRSGGLYNELSGSLSLANDVGLPSYEPRISAVDIHHCDGWGWRHRGPTDLLADRVLVWKCGLTGGTGGIWLERGNGTSLSQCHTYGNVGWSVVADVQAFFTGCQIETGEAITGFLDCGGLWMRFDDSVFVGGSIYRISAAGVPQDGIGLRLGDGPNNKYAVRAYVATAINGFTGADAAHAAIHFSGDASSTIIATVGMNNPSGNAAATTPITGTPDAGSRLSINVLGSSTVKGLHQNTGTSSVGVKAVRTTNQTAFGDGTFAAVVFDGPDVWDTHGFHNPATNNTRITIPVGYGGKYRLQAAFPWVANAVGRRSIRIMKNGSAVVARDDRGASPAGATCTNLGLDVTGLPGDYFEVEVVHSSGGLLDSDVANGPIYFSAEFRG